jgi:ATP-binding cassette subfamily B protein
MARRYDALVAACAALVLAGLVSTSLSGLTRYLHTKLSGRILFALRGDVYAHLQKLSPSFFSRRRLGDLLSRLDTDVAEIQRFAVDTLFAVVSSVVGLFGTVALLLTLSWRLSLIAALLIPLEWVWLRLMRPRIAVSTRQTRESAADLSSFLVETLPAIKLTQTFGQQHAEQRRLDGYAQKYLARLLGSQLTEFITQAVPGALSLLSRATVFLVGGYWVIRGQWPLGSLIAFSSYLGMATGPVKSLLGIYVATQRMKVCLTRVMELREEPIRVTNPAGAQMPAPGVADLELRQVGYAHEGAAHAVLRHASARFQAGAKIALHGASGAGKSTLVELLQRLEDPQQGSIRYGGVPLPELDLMAWRGRIAVVSQDTILLRGSIADNIGYARPDATRQQIQDAARLAGLTSWLDSLPQGLDTLMGERGQQLSGGQRQRVAIARALLLDPAILVLDEATSAVDIALERQILQQMDSLFGDRTRILISHRPETLRDADQHWRLHDGHLLLLTNEATPVASDCAQAEQS